eukprot:8472626-Pyramimonas_sp.AAC.1
MPEHFSLDADVFLTVDSDPREMPQGRPSDHSVPPLNLKFKAPGDAADHCIPNVAFGDVRYKAMLAKLLDAAELVLLVARWQHLKDIMIEAAEQIRDEFPRVPSRA